MVDEAEAVPLIVRNLLGMPDLEVEITGTRLWGNNEMYATHLQYGRVFCAGDAIHRHPPSNGWGRTPLQDSYNLAWKLAAVLRGQAEPTLLDRYSVERAPVAERYVLRANKSSREFVQIFEALGVLEAKDEDEMGPRSRNARQHPPGRGQAGGVRRRDERRLPVQRSRCRTRPVLPVQRRRPGRIAPPAPSRNQDLYYSR